MTTETPTSTILTVPNVISFLRIVGAALFWWVLFGLDDPVLAGWLIVVIGCTDWVDGYLAHRLNQVSELGKALDPVADRLMIVSALIGGLIAGVLPPLFCYLLIARELLMAVVTFYLSSKGAKRLEVRWLGKAATFTLYASIPAFYVAQGETLTGLLTFLAWGFGVVGLVFYWVVAFQYLGDARKSLAAVESRSDPMED